jgi:hypothetical protein
MHLIGAGGSTGSSSMVKAGEAASRERLDGEGTAGEVSGDR